MVVSSKDFAKEKTRSSSITTSIAQNSIKWSITNLNKGLNKRVINKKKKVFVRISTNYGCSKHFFFSLFDLGADFEMIEWRAIKGWRNKNSFCPWPKWSSRLRLRETRLGPGHCFRLHKYLGRPETVLTLNLDSITKIRSPVLQQ